MGDNAHQPLDPLCAPPHAGHGSYYVGREPPPPPLPVLLHVLTLGGDESPLPRDGPLCTGRGEEETVYGRRGGAGWGSDGFMGL